LLKELRVFLDSVLAIEQKLVTEAVRQVASNTITAYSSGVPLKWNDAELGIYLIYLFGEINRSRWQADNCRFRADQPSGSGKGRAAFCQAPLVDRDKRKMTDYSEYPLTPLGEMLFALV
jgi:exportin-T